MIFVPSVGGLSHNVAEHTEADVQKRIADLLQKIESHTATVGVVGGIIAHGIIGLFVGPVMLAVTYTLALRWLGLVARQ